LISNKETKILQDAFYGACSTFSDDQKLIDSLWSEVKNAYMQSHRYYHTLSHLSFMYDELKKCASEIDDIDAMIFALFYHDIIYNPQKGDNEEKSASLATDRLSQLNTPSEFSTQVSTMILKTKNHEEAESADGNLFLDADLAVLGTEKSKYQAYAKSIRKEYSVYPDFLYKPGRLKVIEHFLKMPVIFKTPSFRKNFEIQARFNLQREAESLR
jgi:predicted metal-dependent HD superfamily phosphohydrolase